jgi:hypothetical protein
MAHVMIALAQDMRQPGYSDFADTQPLPVAMPLALLVQQSIISKRTRHRMYQRRSIIHLFVAHFGWFAHPLIKPQISVFSPSI